jgi:hypothetical protein
VWVDTFNSGTEGIIWSVLADRSNRIKVVGGVGSATDVDPGTGTVLSGSVHAGFIGTLDSNGTYLSSTLIKGNSCYLYSMFRDKADNEYISGIFYQSTDFDPGSGVYQLSPSAGPMEAFILNLDSSENFQGVRTIQANNGGNVAPYRLLPTSTSGEFIMGAPLRGSFDYDTGTGIKNLQSHKTLYGWHDESFAQYDTTGTLHWAYSYGPCVSLFDQAWDISPAGDFYSAGHILDTANFDPPGSTYTLVAAKKTGNQYGNTIFIQKRGSCSTPQPTVTLSPSTATLCAGQVYSVQAAGANTYIWSNGLPSLSMATFVATTSTTLQVSGHDRFGCSNTAYATLTVYNCTGITDESVSTKFPYPNPARDFIHIPGSPSTVISLFDITGKTILKRIAGKENYDLPLKDLDAGVYLLQVSDANSRPEVYRIIHER